MVILDVGWPDASARQRSGVEAVPVGSELDPAQDSNVLAVAGDTALRIEKVYETPPPIPLPPSLSFIQQIPPLTEEAETSARSQFNIMLSDKSPSDLKRLKGAAGALEKLLFDSLYVLGKFHSWAKGQALEMREFSRPFGDASHASPDTFLDEVPALEALKTLPRILNLEALVSYWTEQGDKRMQREVRERLFYDLKNMKSILTRYFDFVAALHKELCKALNRPSGSGGMRQKRRMIEHRNRQGRRGRGSGGATTVPQRTAEMTPIQRVEPTLTPLQILGRRYGLDDQEMAFFQELADAGEEGLSVNANINTRNARLYQGLFRKVGHYFQNLPNGCVKLSPMGLRQLQSATAATAAHE